MNAFATVRRRFGRIVLYLAIFSGLALWLAHTGTARRLAFSRLQAALHKSYGLALEARGFDYNLVASTFEFKQITLKAGGLRDMPAPLAAERVVVSLPVWKLVFGSVAAGTIRVQGLVVRWTAGPDGQSNWPSLKGEGGDLAGGPDVLVSGGNVEVNDSRAGLALNLPLDRLSATWDPAVKAYGIIAACRKGHLSWRDAGIALDSVDAKAALANSGFAIDTLEVVSGKSRARVRGTLSGSPATVRASGTLDVDMGGLGQDLRLSTPVRGQVQGSISADGPADALQISSRLSSDRIESRGAISTRVGAEARFNASTGELTIPNLTSDLFSGRLTASGRMWTGGNNGRSEVAAKLVGFDPRAAGEALGADPGLRGKTTVEVTANWPGMNWRSAAVSIAADAQGATIHGKAHGDSGSIRASLDAALGGDADARGEVGLRLADRAVSGELSGTISSFPGAAGQLERLLGRPRGEFAQPSVAGYARWSAALHGTLDRPSASMKASVQGLAIASWKDADLNLDSECSLDGIEFRRLHLTWSGQELDLNGRIGGPVANPALDLEGTVASESLAAALESVGVKNFGDAQASGEVRVTGSVRAPQIETTADLLDLTTFGMRFAKTTMDAAWREGELRVSRLHTEDGPGSEALARLDASGSWVPGGQYRFDLVGRNLRPELVVTPELRVEGAFTVEAQGAGTLANPTVSAKIAGNDVRVGGVDLGELRGEVEAKDRRATAHISVPALNANASSSVALEDDWPFEFKIESENTRLATTPAASFDASVHGSGRLADPSLGRVTAAVRNLHIGSQPQEIVGDGPIEVAFEHGRVEVGRFSLKSGESRLSVSGALPLDENEAPGSLSLNGRIVLDPFSHLLSGVDASKTGGIAEVSVALNGSTQHWEPVGSITIQDARFGWPSVPFDIDRVSGRLDIKDGMMRADEITGNAGTGTLRLDGSIPLRLLSDVFPAPHADPGDAARFSARADGLQWTTGKGQNAATANVGLKVVGQASALRANAVDATIEFSGLGLKSSTGEVRQTEPARITVGGGVARLDKLIVKGANSSVAASGSFDLTGEHALKLDVAGDADLAILSPFVAPLEAAGPARLNMQLSGTVAEPRAAGSIELKDATLAIPDPPLQAAGIKLKATLDGDQLAISDLSGTLNGGPFTGAGAVKLRAGKLVSGDLSLSAKNIFLEYPAGVKTTSSLDLKLRPRDGRPVLEGQVEIQEGYYDATLESFGTGRGTSRSWSHAPDDAANGIALDVGIVTKRPVEMDNNLGRVAATAKLRVAGTADRPRLLGALELEPDGRIYFGDRTYYIERGGVRFLDAAKITPDLNIEAYTRANDYTVHLRLSGQLDEVTTTFTSDPPLSRDDIIAVLLTGKTVAENRGVDLRSLEALAVATGAINASLSSRAHNRMGVSRVSIQPAAVAAESNPGARITITQDFTRTLRLMYSMNLSDSNDQIWVTEYDLSNRFTTRAVKQSDNTYRGEFRHDVRFGTSTSPGPALARAPAPAISRVEFAGGGPFSETELAKHFKLKPGQKANPVKFRKATDKLSKFLAKNGRLESRVRVDRAEDAQGLALAVRIELGPTVDVSYHGASVSRAQKKRVRTVWHNGISDQQRPRAAKETMLDYFAGKGYLRGQVTPEVAGKGDHKDVRFDLQPGTRFHNLKIEVDGAEPYRRSEILALLEQSQLRLSLYRDGRRASQAIARYYERRGYLSAEVGAPVQELDPNSHAGRIIVPITEGPVFRVGDLKFSGNTAIASEELRRGLPLEAGAVFEPARLDPSSAALKLRYGKSGYGEAAIDYETVRHDESASIDILFNITENKQTSIGSIKVEGNGRTSADFARSQLRVAEGDVADTSLIRESAMSLARTGAYASTDLRLQPPVEAGASDQRVQVADLVVALSEPKPYRLLYGGLYDSGGGPGFIADLQNHNGLGPGRVLGLRTRVDPETDEVRVYVTRPFWRQTRLSTTVSTYFTRETELYRTTPTEKLGASIQQDLPLRSKWLLSYGYRFEKQRGFVPDPSAPEVTSEIAYVAPLSLTLSRDSRDSFLDATKGSFLSHGFELAPRFLGSNYPYARYYGQYFKYFPLTRPRPAPYGEPPRRSRLVFATGSRIGIQKGFSEEGAVLTDRFYAGGGTTVRGFGQDELGPKLANGEPAGGNAVLVLNEELRYPLFWVLDAVTFIDAGNVFPRVTDFRLSDMRAAGGFGLRIRNPFVVLRFDYGFKFDRRAGEKLGAFFFSIGQAF